MILPSKLIAPLKMFLSNARNYFYIILSSYVEGHSIKKIQIWTLCLWMVSSLIQSLNSLDSSKPYGGLLLNQKAGGSKELFLPKTDFQNSSTKIFPKKHPDFGGLETNRRHEIQSWFFLHMPLYIRTQSN